MKNFLILLTYLLLCQSCKMKRLDTSHVAEEMKNLEVKRITPAQISLFANEWGTEIVDYLGKNKSNIANVDSLGALFHATIKKLDLNHINLVSLDKKEQEVIEAYQYSIQNNQPIVPNLQKLTNEEIQLFTAPVAGEKTQIWRIEFTKKEIIKKASVKDIKNMETE